MRFNVSSAELQARLQAVSKVVNSKNALSILDNFLLTVEADKLTILGSDQENVVSASMTVADSECDGSVAVNAKRLIEVIKEIPSQGITIYVNDETKEVDVRFLNGHFNFMGVSADEYPRPASHEADAFSLDIPAEVVISGIENTLFAVSNETIRPQMTGIFWDIHQNDITFVSSDTHKLVRYINRQTTPGRDFSFIMPSKPANIIKGILNASAGDVHVTLDTKSATFVFGDFSIKCRYINGNYPNYNRVIPTENPFVVTIDRATLLNATRRVTLFSSLASNLVRFNVQPNELLLSAQDMDYNTSADERVMCEYSGNSMQIGFNGIYMKEVLSNLSGDTILIKLSDPSRSGIFVPDPQNDDEELLMLLMPMQLADY